jgi:hypothetical protein
MMCALALTLGCAAGRVQWHIEKYSRPVPCLDDELRQKKMNIPYPHTYDSLNAELLIREVLSLCTGILGIALSGVIWTYSGC